MPVTLIQVINTLAVNHLRAGLKVCAIKAPGFDGKRSLQDIAITGVNLALLI